MKKLLFYGFLFGYSAIIFTGQETNTNGTALPTDKLTEVGLKLKELELQKKRLKKEDEREKIKLGINLLLQINSVHLTEQDKKMISAIKDSITTYYEKKSHKSVKQNNN